MPDKTLGFIAYKTLGFVTHKTLGFIQGQKIVESSTCFLRCFSVVYYFFTILWTLTPSVVVTRTR